MKPILTRLRTLIAFVTHHSVSVDLRPESEKIQLMIRYYYQGVDHLRDALKAFLVAKQLWENLYGG